MILAIETSCDEVSASLVDQNFCVQKHIIFSSSNLANKTGGVVPELAAREAANMMQSVIKKITKNIEWNHIKAIAVTNGPGLVGSLMTGIETAKTLAILFNKPLIPVFHIFGHMCANFLEQKNKITFPALVLTVSGGHNDIYVWENALEYKRIGTTLDDAAGECFDKCARMLGLGYPGGPLLSKKAESGKKRDDIILPRPLKHTKNENLFNFSFSGLKTALLYKIQKIKIINKNNSENNSENKSDNLDEQTIADLCLEVETAICETLLHKLFLAQKIYKINTLMLSGGVSANKPLRAQFLHKATAIKCNAFIPVKFEYCTDNAAMIGAAAQIIWKNSTNKSFPVENVKIQMKQEI
ncbi:TPA: tRNA (adenosine(37)-N6)-threonylcarbamoyltransferase complex transferase subunit TsaD [Candidatus Gracilibacteria bacterium]|nr:tRNA (adenosine(37)-N6)-threonylcarbamoyltransferase complex transferase subunit TsaD [Candidatus Peregrinibacteria bacterium]HIQ56759.1 tRNA (adenosine(37)-N6)-threonylcarbamoyltransferase complex transferase subunit TsaD [Candidatus Gracilibacteria bacterium]HIQ57573.1 tRNA (adenosine(37)-N6)-threonylcarbamoyltransferase complex transferase subunit TsaD [Candidatus Gracilibacteria bacterium]